MYTFIGLVLVFLIYKAHMSNVGERARRELVKHDVDVMMGVSVNSNSYLVTRVIDGDTIVINNGTKVRVAYVDAYESNTPIHSEIMQFMNSQVLDKYVTIYFKGNDKYGRSIGEVILPSGRSLGLELVSRGYALVYEQYVDKNSDEYIALKQAEDQARIYKIGGYAMLLMEPWNARHQ